MLQQFLSLKIVCKAHRYADGLKRLSRVRFPPTLLILNQFKPLLMPLSKSIVRSNIFKRISLRLGISDLNYYSTQRGKFPMLDSLLWPSTVLESSTNVKDSYGLCPLAKASRGLLPLLLLLALCVRCSVEYIQCSIMNTC